MMVLDAAAGLGQCVNTHATSVDTLVFDDGKQLRGHKVSQDFLMLWELLNWGAYEGWWCCDWMGPSVNCRSLLWTGSKCKHPLASDGNSSSLSPQSCSCWPFPPRQSSWVTVIFSNFGISFRKKKKWGRWVEYRVILFKLSTHMLQEPRKQLTVSLLVY